MQNNPQLFTPNYGLYLNNNQQIQQPQVRYQNQVYTNNQVIYQNQQNQNIYKQQLNQQQIPQAQNNNPQYMKQVQLIQNAHKQYIQIPKNQPNAMIGQGLPKTYPQAQIPNNMVNQYKVNNVNPTAPQKIQYQQIQNQQQILNPKDKAKLAASHLNLSKTANLEPVPQNQPTHLIIQQKQQQIHQHHHQQQPYPNHHQHPVQQQNQKTKVEENITNTIAILPPQPIQTQNQPHEKLKNAQPITKKSATFMTVKSLASIPYNEYPQAEYSSHSFNNIVGYASNSFNGSAKNYNEDMLKVEFKEEGNLHISYFGVFDGHGGDACSKFLKKNMHTYLFNSPHFPNEPIEATRDAFKMAESEFKKIAIQNNILVDKSGSCAVMALIINNMIYSINLGDSRALYSRKGGQEFYQITRDHKPNDQKEKARIEKAGGEVYYANYTIANGQKVVFKEEQFGPGFTFPWRLHPGGLAVSFYILINLGCKNYW